MELILVIGAAFLLLLVFNLGFAFAWSAIKKQVAVRQDVLARVTCIDGSAVELGPPKTLSIDTREGALVTFGWEYTGVQQPAFFQTRNMHNGTVLAMIRTEEVDDWKPGSSLRMHWEWYSKRLPSVKKQT